MKTSLIRPSNYGRFMYGNRPLIGSDIKIQVDTPPIRLTQMWLYQLSGTHQVNKISDNTFLIGNIKLVWSKEDLEWKVFIGKSPIHVTLVKYVHEWKNIFLQINKEEL